MAGLITNLYLSCVIPLTILFTVALAEISFSKLRLIKIHLTNLKTPDRISNIWYLMYLILKTTEQKKWQRNSVSLNLLMQKLKGVKYNNCFHLTSIPFGDAQIAHSSASRKTLIKPF